MTPKHLRQELVNAYEAHSRDAFDAALNRMEAMFAYTGPVPAPGLTAAQLADQWAATHRVPAHAESVHPVANVTFAGSLHCTKPEACDCKSWPQAKTCMHRRSP